MKNDKDKSVQPPTKPDAVTLEMLRSALKENSTYQIGEFKESKTRVTHVWQSNGIYEVRKASLGYLVMKIADGAFPELPQTLTEGVVLEVPKVPYKVFLDLWNFFKVVHNKLKSEVYVSVYYDKENNNWIYFIPKQDVSGGMVDIKPEWGREIIELRKKYIHILETHSHHTMTGRFSAIDDADHTEPDVIHLVIGNIYEDSPTYQIRFAKGTKKVNLSLGDVFDINNDYKFDINLFANWEQQVELPKHTEISHYQYGGGYDKRGRHWLPMLQDEFFSHDSEVYETVDVDQYLRDRTSRSSIDTTGQFGKDIKEFQNKGTIKGKRFTRLSVVDEYGEA